VIAKRDELVWGKEYAFHENGQSWANDIVTLLAVHPHDSDYFIVEDEDGRYWGCRLHNLHELVVEPPID